MAFLGPLVVFFSSVLALPIMYYFNTAQAVHGELYLFLTGVSCILFIFLLNYWAISRDPKADWLLYVFAIGTFAGMVDVIIGLECNGYIHGFAHFYIKNGEPYLGSPYGALISFWDGTVHYILYAVMLIRMVQKKNFRQIALYWVGSFGHSMVVLIPGAVLGKHGVRWSFLLNVPYMITPVICTIRFLNERSSTSQVQVTTPRSTVKRVFDFILMASHAVSAGVAILRGMAVLESGQSISKTYVKDIEPYLKDPIAFPKVQMLVYLFYFTPFYLAAIYGLIVNNKTWLPDWSLLFAGAAAQAQFGHILSSVHPKTDAIYRAPLHMQDQNAIIFWVVNLTLAVAPHLLAFRCCWDSAKSPPTQDPTKKKLQ